MKEPISFTDAEIEQIRNDPKWLVVNGVDPEIDDSLWVDIISMAGTLMEEIITPTYWRNIAKYRLHNGPGYKDGIAIDEPDATRFTLQENGDYLEDKIDNGPLARYYKLDPNFADDHADCKITELKEQNKASGWVDGLPPIGEVCEVSQIDSDLWTKYTMLAYHGIHAWSLREGDVLPVNILVGGCKFRPILTPKQRTIEAAVDSIMSTLKEEDVHMSREFVGVIALQLSFDKLLTLPGESK